MVLARWTVNGEPRVGRVPVPPGARSGSAVKVWMDGAGRVVRPPQTRGQTIERTIMGSIGATTGLAVLLLFARWAVRCVFVRRQLPEWAAAWARVEPEWSGRG
jgi:hypothetical protein